MSIGEGWPQTGLVAGYHLSSTTDFSGNGNTLTNNNTVTFPAGKFGNAANFVAASSQSLSLASAFSLDLSSTVTVNAWVKVSSEPGTNISYTIVDIRSTTGTTSRLILRYVDESGTKKLYLDRGGTATKYTVTLGTTNWYMVTAVYGVGSDKIYLNGNLVVSGTQTNAGAGGPTFNMGGIAGAYGNLIIDEVQIYNVSKSAQWIRQQYAIGSGKL